MRRRTKSNPSIHPNPRDIAHIAVNPLFGVAMSPDLIRTAPAVTMSKEEWILLNADACRALGARSYLETLIAVFTGESAGGDFYDPRCAVSLPDVFTYPMDPRPFTQEQWINNNLRLITEIGPEGWLLYLINVLSGELL